MHTRLKIGPWCVGSGVRGRERLRIPPAPPPIDASAHTVPHPPARRPDDRCRRETMEESPGSTGIRCRLTAGGGDPRDSATENKPPAG